jgi:hypothetical protein
LPHPLFCDQARRHSVDAAFADAAAKIPGAALLCELGLGGSRRQRLVDGRDGQAVTLGQILGEGARTPRDRGGAVSFRYADDELPGAPIVDDAIELAPRRLAFDAYSRQRRRSPRLEVRGRDADATEPEVERYEDLAIAVAFTKTRHGAIRRLQA